MMPPSEGQASLTCRPCSTAASAAASSRSALWRASHCRASLASEPSASTSPCGREARARRCGDVGRQRAGSLIAPPACAPALQPHSTQAAPPCPLLLACPSKTMRPLGCTPAMRPTVYIFGAVLGGYSRKRLRPRSSTYLQARAGARQAHQLRGQRRSTSRLPAAAGAPSGSAPGDRQPDSRRQTAGPPAGDGRLAAVIVGRRRPQFIDSLTCCRGSRRAALCWSLQLEGVITTATRGMGRPGDSQRVFAGRPGAAGRGSSSSEQAGQGGAHPRAPRPPTG